MTTNNTVEKQSTVNSEKKIEYQTMHAINKYETADKRKQMHSNEDDKEREEILLLDVISKGEINTITSRQQNIEELSDDETNLMIMPTYQPPYTATLAPLDLDIIKSNNYERYKRHKHYSNQKSHIEKSNQIINPSNLFIKSNRSTSSNCGRRSRISDLLTTFLENERMHSQIMYMRATFVNIAGSYQSLPSTKCSYSEIGEVNKLTKSLSNITRSLKTDRTSSTLLLPDYPSNDQVIPSITQNININNNNKNDRLQNCDRIYKKPNYSNSSSNHILKTQTQMVETKLAPFAEAPDSEYAITHEYYLKHEKNPSLFFEDGIRSIDFVLVHKTNPQSTIEELNAEKRRVFEGNLQLEGLDIEKTHKEKDNERIYCVKIHAPLEVLRRYAEILKLRMPMKEIHCKAKMNGKNHRLLNAARKIPGMSVVNRSTKSVFSSLKGVFTFFMKHIYVDERYFPRLTQRFTAIYSRDKEYLFDIGYSNFFTPAVRSRIVQFILDRQRFTPKDKDEMAFGIERLITDTAYCAAYPLHDGEISEKYTMRNTLHTRWANVCKWYRYQPLDYVKEYFGVKIGLYFAWLGFYTYMLLLASVVGVICFLYSWITLKNYIPVNELCQMNNKLNITMCPLCDWCNFWDFKETCSYAKITYLIDNPSTVFFTVFMSFWAALFLELWKRYSAEITHRWDLTGFDVHEEHPRPQYLAKLQHLPATRTDYVTNMKEPRVPFWRMKVPAAIFSFSMVLLLIALAFVALIAVVVYRMSMLATLKLGSTPITTSSAIMVATASAAFVNLCLLYVLNYIYNYLAEYLTELEMWRTQTQFDDSLTLKIYLLQFVNYYASIFYIAFFKGKFVGHPGQYNKLFDYRQEECGTGGCLTELCIQLAIIMIGKQAFNSILEVIMPMFWRRVIAIKAGLSKFFYAHYHDGSKEKEERWLKDLKLLEWGPRSLFPEYLEMVLQYGFVTIFVAAFPLAPFFALINNIFEMRLDAKKLLTHHRRPVSQRVRDIGVWYRILDCIGKLSVITNGFIIAFTSDMIPRWVYRALVSPDGSLKGYLEFILSDFRISDSASLHTLVDDNDNTTTCKYTDFREPPDSVHKYQLSNMFYIILACRLGFVVVFENFVALVIILVRWCIPDMSVELRDQIRREIYITNEIIIEQETRRARLERAKRSSSLRLQDNSESGTPDTNDRFIRIEKLLCSDLSQSQLDLIIHGDNTDTGIQGTMV